MQPAKSFRINKIKFQKIQELWSSFDVGLLPFMCYWVLVLSFFGLESLSFSFTKMGVVCSVLEFLEWAVPKDHESYLDFESFFYLVLSS